MTAPTRLITRSGLRSPRERRWLARLSGAHLTLLRDSPNDTAKHTAMGGVMVTTAAVACGSAAFALRTALGAPVWAAALLGLAWGVVVLNLDRALVVSMTRAKGWRTNLLTAVPRVALAFLIGAVISVPLVLQIFGPEIGTELRIMDSERQQTIQERLDTQYGDIPALRARIAALQATAAGLTGPRISDDPSVAAARAAVDRDRRDLTTAENSVICENQGGPCAGGSGQPGQGGLYRDKVEQRNRLQGQLDADEHRLADAEKQARSGVAANTGAAQSSARTDLARAQDELTRRENARRADEIAAQGAAENGNGLLARIEALDRLSSDDVGLATARYSLFALFMSLELLPILVKLIGQFGPPTTYDRLLEAEEAQAEQHALTTIRNQQRERSDRSEAEARRRRADLEADEALARHQRNDLTRRLKDLAVTTNERYTASLALLTNRLQKAWETAAKREVDDQVRAYRAVAPSATATARRTPPGPSPTRPSPTGPSPTGPSPTAQPHPPSGLDLYRGRTTAPSASGDTTRPTTWRRTP